MTDSRSTYKYSNKAKDKSMVSLSVYNVGSQKCTPGYSYGPAIRDHYLIHLIINGKGIYRTKRNVYHLRSNDLFCVLPDHEIYYEADTDDPWEYQWVGFAGVDAASMIMACGFNENHLVIHNVSCHTELSARLSRIENAFGNDYASSVRMTGELCLALCSLFDENLHSEDKRAPSDSDRDYIVRAVSYIQSNYSYNISISDIASFIGVNRSTLYFSKIFHKAIGMPPTTFREQSRINQHSHQSH
jgi:hypothetical protein